MGMRARGGGGKWWGGNGIGAPPPQMSGASGLYSVTKHTCYNGTTNYGGIS